MIGDVYVQNCLYISSGFSMGQCTMHGEHERHDDSTSECLLHCNTYSTLPHLTYGDNMENTTYRWVISVVHGLLQEPDTTFCSSDADSYAQKVSKRRSRAILSESLAGHDTN